MKLVLMILLFSFTALAENPALILSAEGNGIRKGVAIGMGTQDARMELATGVTEGDKEDGTYEALQMFVALDDVEFGIHFENSDVDSNCSSREIVMGESSCKEYNTKLSVGGRAVNSKHFFLKPYFTYDFSEFEYGLSGSVKF